MGMTQTWTAEALFEQARAFQPACILAAAVDLDVFTTLAQQPADAAALARALEADERALRILLDALEGACHRAYGSMPNMSWIFTRSGIPVYKSNWTDGQF